ncbi:MAG TPA: FMN-binding protein, partial [Vicinamibacterales bacterium]|nr:FMN-binding protein [Vicinamibacterales bacterium]
PAPAPSAVVAKPRPRDVAPRSSAPKPSTPAKTPEPVATPAIVEPTPASTPTPTPSPSPTPAPPAAPKWNDGSYSGWGRSRHGDIQATVAIENGKIVYAAITVCATRYPCDVIAKLPGQVLERQSPEVDFVAGATESTNAFYYAVVEALKKAK